MYQWNALANVLRGIEVRLCSKRVKSSTLKNSHVILEERKTEIIAECFIVIFPPNRIHVIHDSP